MSDRAQYLFAFDCARLATAHFHFSHLFRWNRARRRN